MTYRRWLVWCVKWHIVEIPAVFFPSMNFLPCCLFHFFFWVRFWFYCLVVWILVGPGVCLAFMVARDNLKHVASSIKVEKVWESKYLYRSGPCCLILQRWRLQSWWLWAKGLRLGEKIWARRLWQKSWNQGWALVSLSWGARLGIHLGFGVCWIAGKKKLYWWEKIFRIVLQLPTGTQSFHPRSPAISSCLLLTIS